MNHPFGKPINILSVLDSKEIVVNNKELSDIFSHPDIQDRKVVIFSLIGAFRGGKSFLLDYSLRFLYSHFASIKNPNKVTQFIFQKNDDWMGGADDSLLGFSWRSGSKRDTTGIMVWNDIFLHTITSTGEKIAIFVMDTQGLFDSESTPADNSRIFSLGTLMSSIQVLNTMNRIQEDELQYLQCATEFTKFSANKLNNSKGKPFQNLIFLVRDWNNDDEFKYGVEGGEQYINDVLKINPDQKSELRSVRETVRDSFEKIQCCLLPYPGKTVARTKGYDGRWSEMDDEFKVELQSFIEHLLMPDNLLIKRVNSIDVKVSQMHQLSKEYLQLYSSNEVPAVSSIHDLTVENHMKNLIDKCLKDFTITFFRNAQLLSDESMSKLHEQYKERALKLYDGENKMGSKDIEEKFRIKLEEEIDFMFKNYENLFNNNKESFDTELENQRNAIESEKLRRNEVEKAKKQAKLELIRLVQRKAEMKPLEFEKSKLMLESRIEAERINLEAFDKNVEVEFSFTSMLVEILTLAGIAITQPGYFLDLMENRCGEDNMTHVCVLSNFRSDVKEFIHFPSNQIH